MCHDDSASHQHHHCDGDHHNESSSEAAVSMSEKEKLTIRLEHFIGHNKEHACFYKVLVDAAAKMGAEEVARLIVAAAEDIQRQNQNLEKALTILKS